MIALVFIVGAGSGYTLLWRPVGMPPIVGALSRQAQARFASLPTTPLDTPESRAAAAEFLATRFARDSDPSFSDGALRAAAQTIVDFLAVRSTGDPDDYARWAESRSHRARSDWPDWPPGNNETVYRQIAAQSLGGRLPSTFTPQTFFRSEYRADLSLQDGALRPVALCVGPNASESMLTVFTHPADHFQDAEQIQSLGLGDEVWVGGITSSARRFFDPPATLEDILRSHGSARVLRTFVAYEGPTGLRVPLELWLVYDPDRRQWHIHRMFQNNIGHTTGVGPRRAGAPLY